ncbi:transmembrane protein 270 isoform X2 [Cavia porcellus]|uniref:transmembrane protein 270 isoform X2 n=1 Tax=Cavia porcellus TaxID=10141 RepID=UPI002FDF8EF3
MEPVAQGRAGLPEVLLQGARLWALLVQNRVYLYRLLLLKIALFRDWVVELSREARGPCYVPTRQAPGEAPCALGQALRVGLALLLWGPRLAGEAGLRCARAPILALQCLGICEWLGLCVAAWRGVLWSCLHSLMLVALLSLLLAWRLFQRAQCFLGWLPRQALLGNHLVLGFLALPRCLCWHLAYLITWTTCLASHLLQAAFEHTTQLVQAQGSSGSLSRSLLPVSSSTLEGQALLQKPENPGQ